MVLTSNTPQGNFEALWKIIDEQYCFLDYKQIDWDAIHDKYQPLITPGMSYDGLFEILGNMLAELKDGHVNLYSSSNMARYWDWYLDYPRNFNESIIEKYLGRDYRIAGGAKYTILEDNIGYIYYGDFSSGIGNGNLDEILLYLSACNVPSFIRGIDFVGYRIFLKDTLLRKSTCQEFERKMTAIRKKIESGQEMNYSEWCAINSYKGWLKYCDSSRLSEKYIEPIQPYADRYYKDHIKKGGKKHERVRKSTQYKAA